MHDSRRTRLVLGVLLIIAIALITLDFRDGGASPARNIGAVTGTGKSMSGSPMLRLTLFDANTVLEPGQQVNTFASVGDQPEVPGVPVGTIVSVQSSPGSLTQTALVRPFVNFTSLGVVGIVVQVPRHNPRTSILPRPAPTVTVTVTPSPSSSASLAPGAPPPSSGGTSSPSATPSATGGGG